MLRNSGILALISLLLATGAAAQAAPDCPKLEVIGPSGITTRGGLAAFTLEPDLPNSDRLKFEWTVSLGKIEEGQGSPKIVVLADTDKLVASITATVTVTGLPQGCPNSASETVGVGAVVDYFPIDEYSRLPADDERGRLDIALAQIKERPSFDLLFFLRAPKDASKASVAARKSSIERHVVRYRKFSAARVHFVRRDSEQISTQIYMVPRDLVETFIWKEDTILP